MENINRLSYSELKTLFENKTKQNKDKIIISNLYLVYQEAKRYKPPSMEKDDIIQEGTIGLIKAVEMYNINSGVSFPTYARYWINAYIKRAISQKYNSIRIPANMYNELIKYNKGLTTDMSQELKEKLRYYSDLKTVALDNAINCPSIFDIDKAIDNKELLRKIEEATKDFSILEQVIFAYRFYKEKTISSIASELKMSSRTISRIIKNIRKKLKELFPYV